MKFKGCFVGLKAQLTVDGHMLSLREGQSPTKQFGLYVIANAVKQSTCLNGLPRILKNARNDKMAGSCERGGLISHNVLSPSRPIALTPLAKAAFTMAEILLSLTIIGVVAAITLPSLTGNINERTWNTQRKALYSRISQAVALMPNVNGYGVLTGVINDDGTQTITEDTAAETFLSAGLSKVLKINNICDNEHLSDCGLPDKIITFRGKVDTSVGSFNLSDVKTLNEYNTRFDYALDTGGLDMHYQALNTKAAGFETANGESVLAYYNPRCKFNDFAARTITSETKYVQPFMCANFIYDLNGKKGPNTMGKDVGFITVMYPTDSFVVAPVPNTNKVVTSSFGESSKLCRAQDEESRVPNFEELSAMFYNQRLLGEGVEEGDSGVDLWTSKVATDGNGYLIKMRTGTYHTYNSKASLKCVKR